VGATVLSLELAGLGEPVPFPFLISNHVPCGVIGIDLLTLTGARWDFADSTLVVNGGRIALTGCAEDIEARQVCGVFQSKQADSPQPVNPAMQADDPEVGPFYRLFQRYGEAIPYSEVRRQSSVTRAYWLQRSRFRVVDGIMYREWIETGTGRIRLLIVAPVKVREAAIRRARAKLGQGVVSASELVEALKEEYYWLDQRRTLKKFLGTGGSGHVTNGSGASLTTCLTMCCNKRTRRRGGAKSHLKPRPDVVVRER
jgi:hypothetical protein